MAKKIIPLTAKQKQVALLGMQGKTDKEIARALNLAPKTVGRHVLRIRKKLGLKKRRATFELLTWIAEGLMPRLTDDQINALLRDWYDLVNKGSHIYYFYCQFGQSWICVEQCRFCRHYQAGDYGVNHSPPLMIRTHVDRLFPRGSPYWFNYTIREIMGRAWAGDRRRR
jgi:DNA-binding CsgD family transcriptional regulator